MKIKQYIVTLIRQMREHTAPENAREKLDYARAYEQGKEGLKRYRDRAIARELTKVHDRDAQLAILFNEHLEPEEYEAYQAFRVECKAKVDAEMAALKAELEAILNQ